MKMSYPVRVAICGLGSRGKDTYARLSEMLPEQMVIAAIAEPIEEKREYVRKWEFLTGAEQIVPTVYPFC